ncbi:hypothetical protein K7X08_011649 [Anisodus acutangulus]|uniref:CCT domain-containing protein n=1 Tax=Anisodus acutangulus TaxID=402998 RepID=A0A9Q1MNG3_9SOLA|nr:hypothetical protein K7X08_011649 [Anisodus acutangulus]
MSSYLTTGGRAAYKLDIEIIKSPSTSWTSQSSSPSSTLSESSNSPIAISTRKPRTPRKRPNQTYNEAAALLSTAYPKIFNTKHLTKTCKFTKPHYPFSYESSDLFVPYQIVENSGCLLHPPLIEKPHCPVENKSMSVYEKPCQSPGEIDSKGSSSLDVCGDEFQEDFDAESILDEEIEEGVIDNIMGKLNVENNEPMNEPNFSYSKRHQHNNYASGTCYGFPIGLGFENGYQQYDFGMRSGVRPLRNVDDGDWWRYPSVNVIDITPKFSKPTPVKKKKKKVVELRGSVEPSSAKDNLVTKRTNKDNSSQSIKEEVDNVPKPKSGLLKLNFDDVLNAWSDKESPFSDEMPGSEAAGNDVQARLAQIDLFSENGGIREASVLRYKEKRRTRLFSKKIRYQVRKVNADQRPRMKGRFVKSPNSPEDELG